MNERSRLALVLRALVACVALAGIGTATAAAEKRVQFNIAPQDLLTALTQFARQSDQELLFSTDVASSRRTSGVTGEFAPTEALRALLEGTGLGYRITSENTILIERTGQGAIDRRAEKTSAVFRTPLVLAQAAQDSQRARQGTESNSSESSVREHSAPGALETVVVTGTHIRNATAAGSHLIVVDRDEIDRAGVATTQDLVRTLPQNFRGGASEETTAGREASQNRGYEATGINLRGAGNGATLVLIDGRRLTAGGSEGNLTDVSMIPLSAIERIEVLPDGASAAYGSDAIGGVVNFILRRDYRGAETRLRGGSVTHSEAREYLLAQALGGALGEATYGLLSYEFYDRDALRNSERRLAARSDLRQFGGTNRDSQLSNPGTIAVGSQTWAIPPNQNGQSLDASSLVAGTRNLQNALEGRDVLPEQRRHSLFGTIRHDIGPRVSLFADVLYTQRDTNWSSGAAGRSRTLTVPATNPFYVNPTGGTGPITVRYNFIDDLPPLTDFEGKSYNAAAGARVQLAGDWALAIDATYSSLETKVDSAALNGAAINAALADPNPTTALNPFGDGSFTNVATLRTLLAPVLATADSDLAALRTVADGPLFNLGARVLRLAVGAEHRRESLHSRLSIPAFARNDISDTDRTVNAAFVELLVPLLERDVERQGSQALTVSLAARHDDYSDFGRSSTPKVGLNWSPVEGVTLRGTWSKSFKAPNLTDVNETNNTTQLFPTPDPQSATGSSDVLALGFKNADLDPERATVWSVGATLEPTTAPGLKVTATYFDIDFKNRIEDPPFGDFLNDPTFQDLVTRNPTASQREEVCSGSTFLGAPEDCLNAPIAAILDFRIRNTATSNIAGFDIGTNYRLNVVNGELGVGLSATYLSKFERQPSPRVPVQELLNTATNPVDLRLRGQISWTQGRWGATGYVNYTDGYRDPLANREVGSWTTADVQVAYGVEKGSTTWLEGTSISVSAQNVFDREPPFYDNPRDLHGYDGENAGILGRLLSLQIRKSW